jgi:hypothetical protein
MIFMLIDLFLSSAQRMNAEDLACGASRRLNKSVSSDIPTATPVLVLSGNGRTALSAGRTTTCVNTGKAGFADTRAVPTS